MMASFMSLRRALLVMGFLNLLLSIYLVKMSADASAKSSLDFGASSSGGPAASGASCDYNAVFSCSTVLTSKYANFAGVSVATLGFFWNVSLLFVALQCSSAKDRSALALLLGWLLSGLAFAVYLFGAEMALGAVCPACTLVHVLIIVKAVLAWQMAGIGVTRWPSFALTHTRVKDVIFPSLCMATPFFLHFLLS